MSAKVLFLTEAGEGIGYGHLSRSIALADGFELLGCDITFTVRGVKNPVIQNRTFTEVNREWFDKELLEATISKFDITVIDSYKINENLLNFISERLRTPVFLIDSQLKHGNRGIILFPSVYAEDYTFESSSHVKILSGIRYLLFTKEMWKGPRVEVNEVVKSIGISMGSSSLNGNGLSTEKLKRMFPGLTQICVFGNVTSNDWADHEQVKVDCLGRLQKEDYIAKLQTLDLLISNGGQTLNEALLIGLPVLPIVTADNQLKNVIGWEKKNLVHGLDARIMLEPNDLVDKLNILGDYITRKEFNEKCRYTIDSKGAIRSAREILTLSMNQSARTHI